jgi:hypothetical protein
MDVGGGDVPFERAVGTTDRRRLRDGAELCQHGQDRAEGLRRDLQVEAVDRFQTRVPACFSASIRTRGVSPRKSAPVLDISLPKPWWA